MGLEGEIPFEEYRDKRLRIKFTEQDVLDELDDIMYADKESVNFVMKVGTDMVDVYYHDTLLYKITRDLYNKILEGEEHKQALRDCARDAETN